MPKNPDIQYLRVRQVGGTNSLLISDLDVEANKKQPYQIPVYIPATGSIDLPLNDQVLLSYNQGSLRGFVQQGRVVANVVANSGTAEVWVSPDGDDEDPGTANAPKKSIQAAIDHMVSEKGHDAQKMVHALPGEYEESLYINTKNLMLHATPDTVSIVSDGEAVITVCPWTREAFEAFQIAGGLSYDEATLTYDGATTAGRDFEEGVLDQGSLYLASVTLHGLNITAMGYENTIEVVGPDEISAAFLTLSKCKVSNDAVAGRTMFVKNFSQPTFEDVESGIDTVAVLDTVASLRLVDSQLGDTVITYNDLPVSTQSVLFGRGSGEVTVLGGNLVVAGRQTLQNDSTQPSTSSVYVEGELQLENEIATEIKELFAGSLVVDCPEGAVIRHLDIEGDVTLTEGSLKATGLIRGNLTVGAGVAIDFSNLTVLGDVTLDATSVVTGWIGGTFGGTLTDPAELMGVVAAGDYLFIS